MDEQIRASVVELGGAFATENVDEDTLRDAIMTGHVTPDELGEAFITGVLESLGLENNLMWRRDDKLEKVERVLEPVVRLRSDRIHLAEKIVDALIVADARDTIEMPTKIGHDDHAPTKDMDVPTAREGKLLP